MKVKVGRQQHQNNRGGKKFSEIIFIFSSPENAHAQNRSVQMIIYFKSVDVVKSSSVDWGMAELKPY